MAKEVGKISTRVAELLDVPLKVGQPILMGESNISHMMNKHPADYEKYGRHIPMILAEPDYVGINPSDNSVEYVKEFQIDNDYVKVAVRLSGGGALYARSLYVLNPNRVHNFIEKGTLKRV